MESRFVGQISGRAFSYLSLEPLAVLPGRSPLTVLADGFLTNIRELEVDADRRTEPPATSVGGWIGLAYRWWGTRLSRHVLGQFAASIIDHSDGSVTLIQDSLGIQPLFYRPTDDGLAFATRLVDLVSLLRPSALDLEYFADALAHAIPRTERTPYAGIRRVTYGASVAWRAGRVDVSWPWVPSMGEVPRPSGDSEYEAELGARLSMAVDCVIPRNQRVWCELSGGLDSTSVLAVGLGKGHTLEAFSFVSPEGDDGGDTVAATDAVTAMNVQWHTLDAAKTLPFSTTPVDFRAEPGTEIYGARQAAYHALLNEHGVNVVLTGVGGDATFGGPDCLPHHLADPLTAGRPLLLWRTLRNWQRKDPRQRSMSFWFTQYSIRTATRHLCRAYLNAPDSSGQLPTWFAEDFVRHHRIRSRARAQGIPRHPTPGRHALWQEVYGRAAALAVGRVTDPRIEFRHPLLDRRLVEFMLTIPYDQRQLADCDRYLQRRALRDVLPDHVLQRHSKGSGQPTFDLGLRTSAPWLSMLTEAPRIVAAGFVEREAWLAQVQRARFGVYESLRHFVMAACIECWLRRMEQGLPEPVRLKVGGTLA